MVETVDKSAFKVGENIAATKGNVVLRNELMELIQYTPVKKEVFATPLLIITAWINKFYILDLSAENSLVKWLLEQGFNVFIISWRNPESKDRNLTFDDYIKLGIIASIDEVLKITKAAQVNCMGYCMGGTTLAMALAYLKKSRPENVVNAVTFVASLIDFSDTGLIGELLDEKVVEYVESLMQENGYLDHQFMQLSFQLLRSNDLLWPYFISNYWLGKTPAAFDILYWNADSTRLPEDMHSYYLRNMYLNNNLVKPNVLSVLDVLVDISCVDNDIYIMAAKSDHIVPWHTAFNNLKFFPGLKRFVLSAAGHVAAIVNPPINKKYSYWVSENDTYDTDADSWLNSASKLEHSWWEDWGKWLAERSGSTVEAAKVESQVKLAEAPGEYIHS